MTADELTGRLAELAVDFGANLQPGQLLFVQAEPAHAPLVRAVAAAAYRRGARFVDAFYFDPWVKRARIAHAPDDTLEYVPPWYSERILALGEQRCARLWITGPRQVRRFMPPNRDDASSAETAPFTGRVHSF